MVAQNAKSRAGMSRSLVWLAILLVVALVHGSTGGALAPPTPPPTDPVALLTVALEQQIRVNDLLTAPELDQDVQAIRQAVRQATPHALAVKGSLQAALGQVGGETREFTQAALEEVNNALALAPVILFGSDELVVARHIELVNRGGVALASINLALLTLGAGPSAPAAGRLLQVSDLQVPAGYRVEILANELNFLTAVTVAQDGTVYVAESGYSYGNVRTPPRVLRIPPSGGAPEVVAAGAFTGPIAGLAATDTALFVSHRNTISSVDVMTGEVSHIITGLPSLGDHFNENIAIGPDNKLYIAQGVATNSGVVGPDNYFFGWLQLYPTFHDIPCRDLTLSGQNYLSGNPLTPDPRDVVSTGAYLPFGTPSAPGQVVEGQVKCNGAVLRANLDGSGLEVVADGFRNNYGLAFRPDGRLFTTEQGPDARGTRPVRGPDNFYEVVEDGWYGWPDFYGGVPVNDPSRTPPSGPPSQPVLLNPPPLARLPFAEFPEHSTAVGFDFARAEAFAPRGTAFVSLFGDLTPVTSAGVVERTGHEVVMVMPAAEVSPFITSEVTSTLGQLVFRPTDATFDPSGQALYVTHFGEINAVPGGVAPRPATGALIRMTRGAE
jgi:glucose/arabinose dehydrogenase